MRANSEKKDNKMNLKVNGENAIYMFVYVSQREIYVAYGKPYISSRVLRCLNSNYLSINLCFVLCLCISTYRERGCLCLNLLYHHFLDTLSLLLMSQRYESQTEGHSGHHLIRICVNEVV